MLETCRGMKLNLIWNKFCASSWLNSEINLSTSCIVPVIGEVKWVLHTRGADDTLTSLTCGPRCKCVVVSSSAATLIASILMYWTTNGLNYINWNWRIYHLLASWVYSVPPGDILSSKVKGCLTNVFEDLRWIFPTVSVNQTFISQCTVTPNTAGSIEVLFIHQLMQGRVVLKTILKFILKICITTAPTCFGVTVAHHHQGAH